MEGFVFPFPGGKPSSRRSRSIGAGRHCQAESRDPCELDWSFCTDGRGGFKEVAHGYGAIARPRYGSGKPVMETRGRSQNDADRKAREACKRLTAWNATPWSRHPRRDAVHNE